MPRSPFRLTACLALVAMMLPAVARAEDGMSPDSEQQEQEEEQTVPTALSFTVLNIEGEEVPLSNYLGDVVLMVNVASKCGYTKQYEDLQALHETYADRGLSILGFPCNQFKGQEPGTNEQVLQFCRAKYGVEFDMFSKINVNDNEEAEEVAAPLFAYLTSEDCPVEDQGPVKWNFEKFLIDREGNVIARYRSKVVPTGDEMVEAIEAALGPVENEGPGGSAEGAEGQM